MDVDLVDVTDPKGNPFFALSLMGLNRYLQSMGKGDQKRRPVRSPPK